MRPLTGCAAAKSLAYFVFSSGVMVFPALPDVALEPVPCGWIGERGGAIP